MSISGLGYGYLANWGSFFSNTVTSAVHSIKSFFTGQTNTQASAAAISALHDDLDKPREKCGVFAYFSPGYDRDLGKKLYKGLIDVQHRGQSGCGWAYRDNGNEIKFVRDAIKLDQQGKVIDKEAGLVNKVFDENAVNLTAGNFGIAHTLYTTAGKGKHVQAHPFVIGDGDHKIALVHNGNLSNLEPLIEFLKAKKISTENKSDSAMMADAVQYFYQYGKRAGSLEAALQEASKLFIGTYSLAVMDKNKIAILRDPSGNRPFSIAKVKNGDSYDIVVCSETSAFRSLKAEYIRDVAPGELLVVDAKTNIDDLQNKKPNVIFSKTANELCALEYIYLMKPNSMIAGKSLSEIRRDLGKQVAKEFKARFPDLRIDYVVPIPESGIPAATGFAEQLKLPINPAIIKNFHRRTFIDEGKDVESKFSIIEDAIKDKKIVLVDDSIIKGNSSKPVLEFVKKAKPKEVHLVSSSPKVMHPNYYGINIPGEEHLIAYRNQGKLDKIAKEIGAKSVTYLSKAGFKEALGKNRKAEMSIFTGNYKVEKLAEANGLAV